MLTASVYIDLSTEPDLLSSHDRRELAALDQVPDGAHVVIDIGSRQWANDDVARIVHRHVDRLDIELKGTTRANLRLWVNACRTGSMEAVV